MPRPGGFDNQKSQGPMDMRFQAYLQKFSKGGFNPEMGGQGGHDGQMNYFDPKMVMDCWNNLVQMNSKIQGGAPMHNMDNSGMADQQYKDSGHKNQVEIAYSQEGSPQDTPNYKQHNNYNQAQGFKQKDIGYNTNDYNYEFGGGFKAGDRNYMESDDPYQLPEPDFSKEPLTAPANKFPSQSHQPELTQQTFSEEGVSPVKGPVKPKEAQDISPGKNQGGGYYENEEVALAKPSQPNIQRTPPARNTYNEEQDFGQEGHKANQDYQRPTAKYFEQGQGAYNSYPRQDMGSRGGSYNSSDRGNSYSRQANYHDNGYQNYNSYRNEDQYGRYDRKGQDGGQGQRDQDWYQSQNFENRGGDQRRGSYGGGYGNNRLGHDQGGERGNYRHSSGQDYQERHTDDLRNAQYNASNQNIHYSDFIEPNEKDFKAQNAQPVNPAYLGNNINGEKSHRNSNGPY
jgi:hypothetical protein